MKQPKAERKGQVYQVKFMFGEELKLPGQQPQVWAGLESEREGLVTLGRNPWLEKDVMKSVPPHCMSMGKSLTPHLGFLAYINKGEQRAAS